MNYDNYSKSKNTFRCDALSAPFLAALALKEEIAYLQFRHEWVLGYSTDVLSHDDDYTSSVESAGTPLLLQELADFQCTQRCTSWQLA